ncbi:MAG: toast rack family protein [Bacillota bacterium]
MRTAMISMMVLLVALVSVGCGDSLMADHEEFRNIEPGEADTVRGEIDLGVGQLWLVGGGSSLLDARFLYSEDSMRPELSYDVSGSVGNLNLSQPRVNSLRGFTNVTYQWDLRLGSDITFESVDVEMGVGTADLYFGGVDVETLDVHLGVGDMKVDLTGPRARDLKASVEGGVGRCVLTVPEDVGVRVEVERGVSHLEVEGLRRGDGFYFNDAYGETDVEMRISVSLGVGQIVVRSGR